MVTNDSDSSGKAVVEGRSKIRVGVSSCLLGARVRFDGDHKHDPYLTEILGRYVEFVPVCPEVAIGLGVPREPIRLIGDAAQPRAVDAHDATLDFTDRLSAYGRRMARALGDVSGYILKSKSPSCGLARVKVYGSDGVRNGRGVYAAAFVEARPLVPVEEESRLGDLGLRENFIERVFAYHRWQRLVAAHFTVAKLVEFHSAHKLCLMAHSQSHYRALGRLVAGAGRCDLAALQQNYIYEFMEALRQRATRSHHSNVLMHLMGYLKKHLDSSDKLELLALIRDYRVGRVSLIAPITLLRHHFRHHPHPYVAGQVYFDPHPAELVLRNAM